jgi:hypothetical protein
MKTEISKAYQDAKKSGRVEFAQLDHKKNSAIRAANLLKALSMAGIPLPATIPGEEVNRLLAEVESRGIHIPEKPFSAIEVRKIADSLKEKNIVINSDITANMTEKQKALYLEFLRLKNNGRK